MVAEFQKNLKFILNSDDLHSTISAMFSMVYRIDSINLNLVKDNTLYGYKPIRFIDCR